jgi:hypothetical protein
MNENRFLAPCCRAGAVTVWVLLSLSGLIAVVALTLDGGRVLEERRHAQGAADAAALAAGAEMYLSAVNKTTPNVNAVALNMAARYGYTGNGVDSTVTVNRPPSSGAFAGNSDYVEVIIRANLDNTFGRLFTRQKMVVEGRAVARGRPAIIGVVALASSISTGFEVSGNGSFRVSNASIRVNSTSTSAYRVGDSAFVSAQSHNVVGGFDRSGSSSISGTRRTGVPPIWDQMAGLPAPNPGSYPTRAKEELRLSEDEEVTIWPGVYEEGIDITDNATVRMMPGIYIMGSRGFDISGNATVTGDEVMIYNSNVHGSGGGIDIGGSGSIRLTPPQSGTYTGISIFQKRGMSPSIDITGNGNVDITGLIYANAARVELRGNAGFASDLLASGIVAHEIRVRGDGRVRVNPGTVRPRIPDIGLAE